MSKLFYKSKNTKFTSREKFTSSEVERRGEEAREMVTTYFEKTHKEPFPHFSTKRSAWRNLLRTIKASSGYTFGITFVKIFPIQSSRGLLYHNSYINTARDFSIVYLERSREEERGAGRFLYSLPRA